MCGMKVEFLEFFLLLFGGRPRYFVLSGVAGTYCKGAAMSDDELLLWADRIIRADPDGKSFIRTDVAPAVQRVLREKWATEVRSSRAYDLVAAVSFFAAVVVIGIIASFLSR